MKNPTIKTISFALIFSFASCVPAKKYKALEELSNKTKDENKSLHTVMEENDILKQDLLVAERNLREAYSENEMLTISNKRLSKDFEDIYSRYEEAIKDNNSLINANSFAQMEMERKMNQMETEQKIFAYSSKGLEDYSFDDDQLIDSLETRIIQQQYKINELYDQVSYYQDQLNEIESNLSNSFADYENGEYKIEQMNNRLYLSLSHDLLFKKGSTRLDKKGIRALQKFATNFNDTAEMEFIVEGHTDSDGSSSKNWEISTKRAVSVVEQLVKLGIDPKTITASGRSYYHPLVPNSNETNKSKNRRTEIIIIPTKNN
jgi:chemotaxis protein MotB